MRSSEQSPRFVKVVLYAAAALSSCLVLFAGLRRLDPNRIASQKKEIAQKARQQQKEIAQRLGRPLSPPRPTRTWLHATSSTPTASTSSSTPSAASTRSSRRSMSSPSSCPCAAAPPRALLFTSGSGRLLGPHKGVLLYGPPGTGKTMLAKAIARESGAVFINVRTSNLMSKWFGDAQKLVAAVFSLAHKLLPDEADSFLGQRRTTDREAMSNIKTEFMSLWDGFTTDQNARVMVLAATNRPSKLDEAILRRFTQSDI